MRAIRIRTIEAALDDLELAHQELDAVEGIVNAAIAWYRVREDGGSAWEGAVEKLDTHVALMTEVRAYLNVPDEENPVEGD